MKIQLQQGDALLIVDVQNDFLAGGSLAVPDGDGVLPPLNQWIERFAANRLPVFATRDWHPPDHCSFKAQGGPWPSHCVANTMGAQFADHLKLPCDADVVSKATTHDTDAYSGFGNTDLPHRLQQARVRRVVVGGLATDYCVLNTVLDALRLGYDAVLLTSAIRAVNVRPGDGARAIATMLEAGATIQEE